LELRPGDISFQLNQASALAYYGAVEEARTIFKAILKTDPGNTAARAGLESLDSSRSEDLMVEGDPKD